MDDKEKATEEYPHEEESMEEAKQEEKRQGHIPVK